MTTKAIEAGYADAETFLAENPRDQWARAVRPGTLGADEELCNALGVEEACKALGVEQAYDEDGDLTAEAEAALAAYSSAWRQRVEEALACAE